MYKSKFFQSILNSVADKVHEWYESDLNIDVEIDVKDEEIRNGETYM